MAKLLRRTFITVMVLGSLGVLTPGAAGASAPINTPNAPNGGPMEGNCTWSGFAISGYNSTKEPGGPTLTSGSVIAFQCAPANRPA